MRRIISLTSIPPRFPYIGRTLRSLARQDIAVDGIELYLPESSARFPDAGEPSDLPSEVEVIRVAHDYGPGSKLLHAAKRHAGTDTQIAVCDDDQIYPADWARCLFETQSARPGNAVTLTTRSVSELIGQPVQGYAPPGPYAVRAGKHETARARLRRSGRKLLRALSLRYLPDAASPAARQAGYSDVVFGFAGFCVRADFVDAPFHDMVPPYHLVDDVWFGGHLARRGIPIWVPADGPMPRGIAASRIAALNKTKAGEMDRKALDRNAALYLQETYGVWGGKQTLADGQDAG